MRDGIKGTGKCWKPEVKLQNFPKQRASEEIVLCSVRNEKHTETKIEP